jgi:hypothetical protein
MFHRQFFIPLRPFYIILRLLGSERTENINHLSIFFHFFVSCRHCSSSITARMGKREREDWLARRLSLSFDHETKLLVRSFSVLLIMMLQSSVRSLVSSILQSSRPLTSMLTLNYTNLLSSTPSIFPKDHHQHLASLSSISRQLFVLCK